MKIMLMQVIVEYHDGNGVVQKMGYMSGYNPTNCLQKCMDRVKPYADERLKLRAVGTIDFSGPFTDECQPADFWDDPNMKSLTETTIIKRMNLTHGKSNH
jgi:hypothetical protein